MRISVKPLLIFTAFLAIVAVARIPVMLAPPYDTDEGTYAAISQELSKGALLYHDIYDNKTPGIYFLYDYISQINHSFVSFRVAATISLLIAAATGFYLARRSMSSAKSYVFLAIMAVWSIVPIFETNSSNAEIFFLPFTVGAILLTYLVEFEGWSKKYYLLVGALLAVGFLLKVLVVLDGMAIVLFLVLKYRSAIFRPLILITSGALLVILIPAWYVVANGLTYEFFNAAFLGNLTYVLNGNRDPGLFFIHDAVVLLTLKFLILLVVTGIIFWRYRRGITFNTLFFLWLTWTLYGATLSSRPYPHYLVATMVAMALLLAERFVRIWPDHHYRRYKAKVIEWMQSTVIAVVVVGIVALSFSGIFQLVRSSPEITRIVGGYFTNTFLFLVGGISTQQYYDFYGALPNFNLKVAQYVMDNTNPQDKIFIYGNTPWIYYLSERRDATQYVVAYHLSQDKNGESIALNQLITNRPQMIIVTNEPQYIAQTGSTTPNFPGFNEFLHANYRLKANVDTADIYELSPFAYARTP